MSFKWTYIIAFVLAVALAVVLSMPTRLTRAEMSRDSGHIEDAITLLRREHERMPSDPSLALRLAAALQEGNRGEEAIEVLREARVAFPDNPAVLRALATQLALTERVREALRIYPENLRDKEFYLLCAEQFEMTGELRDAEKMLLSAWGGDTTNVEVWLKIAELRKDLYNLDGEAEALRRVIDLEPTNVEALERYFLNRAWALDAPEAIRVAAILDKLAPPNYARLEALLSFQLAARDTVAAEATAEKIATLPDSGMSDSLTHAEILRRNGNDRSADRIMLGLLADPKVEADIAEAAATSLRESAVRNKNLSLAVRLADMTSVSPDQRQENVAAAVALLLEAGLMSEARRIMGSFADAPDASPELLAAAFELARRAGDHAAIPGLVARMVKGGANFDDLIAETLESPLTTFEWRREVEKNPNQASSWLGLARSAIRDNNFADAGVAADMALARIDYRDPVDSLAMLEVLLAVANAEPAGGPARMRRIDQALRVIAAVGPDNPLASSRWFLVMAADAYERRGDTAMAEAYWRRTAELYPDDFWSWMGMARAAADRGDEGAVESILAKFQREGRQSDPDNLRSLAYVHLAMADHYRDSDPPRARAWAERAGRLVAENMGFLPPENRDNRMLFADIAERAGDWRAAREHWSAIASMNGGDAQSWLGVARASIALREPDAAWEALLRADALATPGNYEQRTQIAQDLLSVADSMPRGELRDARLARAERLAEQRLAERWDPELAVSLVGLAVQAGDLERARGYLRGRGDAPPAARATLAEAFLAGNLRAEALEEARGATASTDRVVKLRAAAVLGELGRREEARAVIAQAEAMPGNQETPEYMRALAGAYGAVEDYPRQFALMERRALLGGEPEWLEAVDARNGAGDYAGAMALLIEAEKRYPDSAGVIERAIVILSDANRPGRVLSTYEAALADIPEIKEKLSADAIAALGNAARDLRQPGRARAFYRESLDKEPANKRGAMGYAVLLLDEGKQAAAIGVLREYTEKHADDPWGWLELANARSRTSQTGRPEYRKVLELTEPGPNGEVARSVRAARAVALRQLEREKEALALLRSAVENKIDDPNIACDYAQMLMETGRYDECDEVLREVAKLFPYHVWAYRLEATSLVRRKKYDLAVARLKEALVWAPDDGETQRDLGFAAQLWERTWEAQKGWLSSGGR